VNGKFEKSSRIMKLSSVPFERDLCFTPITKGYSMKPSRPKGWGLPIKGE